ncbi:MAG: hypothetical protein M1820_002071 [Bogoriella megaspora]|nr:MAG: hypothetical protein M1820_002071 [Bogoriella megaspora]
MVQTTLASWLSSKRTGSETSNLSNTRSKLSNYSSTLSNFPIDPRNPVKAGETLQSPSKSRQPPSNPTSNPIPDTQQQRTSAPSTAVPPPRAPLSNSAPLDPRIYLASVTESTLPSLRRLNTLLLPIPYPPTFYQEILSDPITSSITLIAIWRDRPTDNGIVVGGVRCKLRPLSTSTSGLPNLGPTSSEFGVADTSGEQGRLLYISTLAVLSPYRGHGIAAHLLKGVLKRAVREYGVKRVGAHVWEANEEGLGWYERRGFERMGSIEGYYPRLRPQGAWVVERGVGVMDLLDEEGSG